MTRKQVKLAVEIAATIAAGIAAGAWIYARRESGEGVTVRIQLSVNHLRTEAHNVRLFFLGGAERRHRCAAGTARIGCATD